MCELCYYIIMRQPGRSSEKTFLQWMRRVDEERAAAWEIEQEDLLAMDEEGG